MFGSKATGIGVVADMFTTVDIGPLQDQVIVMFPEVGSTGLAVIIGEKVAGTGK